MDRKILLVDDEPNILSALTRLLRKDGYKISRANSGKEGLAFLEEESVGVIISDQRMPEMTGVEFLSQVKEKHPETIRMVLSGYTDLNSVTDAINKGAVYRFLTKPWDDQLLRQNVEEAFGQFEIKQLNKHLADELKQKNQELANLNGELEQRVNNKTRELTINLQALQVSQDVFNSVPFPILGVSEDNIIVCANEIAHTVLTAEARGLIGESIDTLLPPDLCKSCLGHTKSKPTCLRQATINGHDSCKVYCSHVNNPEARRGRVIAIIPE